MMNGVIKLIWKLYSLALQCSTAPSPLEKEMEDEVEKAIRAQPKLFGKIDNVQTLRKC
jgi:hypothetical protein